ncbi:hypothetical protein BKA66DRAFT_479721 [Pyrenochaeta sp. MPI-SDFR-AT-0127]|nr:hypothetical protein BKA66DRAFT_479721 [Pyrenochaeta sp. MPI-SDFR-AT-0127]
MSAPTTTTNIFRITYTTRDTVVITPSATTYTDILTTTTTFTTTTTTAQAARTIPTPPGFLPLLAGSFANPTPIPRIKRGGVEGRDAYALHMFKRQTAANHTGGFVVDRNGITSSLDRKHPMSVNCSVIVTVNSTSITIVTGLPETQYVPVQTATALSTSTVSVTTTITETAPQETIYQACAPNNVVNAIEGYEGNNALIFDRVIFRPAQGFPIENEMVVNTTSGTKCCIACHTTPNCAGSFYAPSAQECHLRLTQPPSSVPSLPAPSASPSGAIYLDSYSNSSDHYNATYAYPTASAVATYQPQPTGSVVHHSNGTCPAGSLSLYLGAIQGQEDFPREYALAFSNGPCGYLSVWPVPVRDLDDRIEDKKMKLI